MSFKAEGHTLLLVSEPEHILHLPLSHLQLIKNSQSLKKLGLSNNVIGKPGCQALTVAISVNQSLNHIQLLPGKLG